MNLEFFPINRLDISCKLDLLARDMPGKTMDIAELDKPVALTQETRENLPRLGDESRERLKGKEYPDPVLDAIDSEAEARIYEQAELKPEVVDGRDALIRTDIDYDKPDLFGETNLDRMKDGRAPLDANDRPIELHHIGQKADSPLAELTGAEHRSNGNDNILHNKLKESEIDRTDFCKQREEYWKARAEQIENQRGEGNK
ncbi:HNH/ENDO VII family nuclease [Massilia sp. LXY-6]|uniref:HNH/ENDO VII family nuclease n=1 Tax=Massilia sp. LXY-6 TaxID=3379823 RepID=UPI003EE152CA